MDTKQFFVGLREARSITHLILKFAECKKLKQDAVDGLGNALRRLVDLKYLGLTFENCIGLQKLQTFGRGLEKLTEMTYMQLDFSGCKQLISDDIRAITQSLKISGGALKTFDFQMRQCPEIVDISPIGTIIPKCDKIENFFLDFRECEKVKNMGVIVAELDNTRNFPRLDNFEIRLEACSMLPYDMQKLGGWDHRDHFTYQAKK
jgi:hypothetical protein